MQKQMQRILLFGGTFDPIHKTHLQLVQQAMQQYDISHAFLIPAFQSPHKQGNGISQIADRLQMLRLAIDETCLKHVSISDYECNQKSVSYTIETVNFFKKQFPNSELFLLIGADHVLDFDQWKNPNEIAAKTQIIYAPRTNYDLSVAQSIIDKYHMLPLKVAISQVSSSYIRNFPNCSDLLPTVLDYIIHHGLYLDFWFQHLSTKRFQHSLRTAQMAQMIARENNLSSLINSAYVAGLFHDFAKEIDQSVMLEIASQHHIVNFAHSKTLHGPVGAVILREQYGFRDEEILSAIHYHTEPFLNDHKPTLLDKIIYCADKIEVDRKKVFQDPNYYLEIQQLCFRDLEAGFLKIYELSNKYMVKKQLIVKEN